MGIFDFFKKKTATQKILDTEDLGLDPLFEEAARLIVSQRHALSSFLQLKFSIENERAQLLIEQLAEVGVVGKQEDPMIPRKVLIHDDRSLNILLWNYWAANRKPDIIYIQNEAKKDASYTYWHVEYILKKYILEMQYVAVKAMLDSNVNIDEEIEKVNKLYMFDDVMKNRLTDQDSHLREKAHQYYDNWEIPGFCYQSKVWLDVFYDGVHTSTILELPRLELSQKLRAKIEGRRKNQ